LILCGSLSSSIGLIWPIAPTWYLKTSYGVWSFYSPEAMLRFVRIMEMLYGAKNRFGYNFAENERI